MRSGSAWGGWLVALALAGCPVCYGQTDKPAVTGSTPKPPADVAAAVGAHAAVTTTAVDAISDSTNAMDKMANDALQLLAAGQVKAAVPLFKEVLRENKTHRKALFGLGTCYIELRQYREAELVLQKMIETYPDAFEAMNNLAWMYATSSDPSYRDGARAVRYAQQAVLLVPTSYEIWNTLSESYYVAGDYARARRAAAEAVRLATENKAADRVIREYQRQLAKCEQAAEAMSLVE